MKTRFHIIIVLMALSLIGIIVIQAFWIKYAYDAESARFDQAVYKALDRGVMRIERMDAYNFLDRELDLPKPPKMDIDSLIYFSKPGKPHRRAKYLMDSTRTQRSSVLYLSDSNRSNHIITIIDEAEPFKDVEVIWKTDSLDIDIDVFTDVLSDYDAEIEETEEIIKRTEHEIHNKKARVLREKYDRFNETMTQWVYEYTFDDETFSRRLLRMNLDTIISKTLKNNGITLNYNYQVVFEGEDTTKIVKSSADSTTLLSDKYKTELFPEDLFMKNLFLKVSFPDRSSHLYRSISLLILGSFIFTLIILVTFGMTLYYMQKQKKISDIKSDFISNMTHEFKTPIATISLATDTMNSPKVLGKEKETKYYLDIIRQENKRMNKQVEKVLQMALIENEDFHLDFQLTDVHPVIESVCQAFDLNVKKKGGKIVSMLRSGCSKILIDEIHIANVLNNIFDNALKYNEKTPEILVETYHKKDQFFIRISDNGTGMSKEVQEHIFDKFYRKPSGNIHNVKGFGLGLSYVKAIVAAHGGSISVSSEPGAGSTFIISFNC
jgi:two-component system phosphate regulon sensor histidine kinase PhoR